MQARFDVRNPDARFLVILGERRVRLVVETKMFLNLVRY